MSTLSACCHNLDLPPAKLAENDEEQTNSPAVNIDENNNLCVEKLSVYSFGSYRCHTLYTLHTYTISRDNWHKKTKKVIN